MQVHGFSVKTIKLFKFPAEDSVGGCVRQKGTKAEDGTYNLKLWNSQKKMADAY